MVVDHQTQNHIMTKNQRQQAGVTPEEFQKLLIATADLPFIRETRGKTDYMLDVLETTLNLHIQEPVVVQALNFFQRNHNQPPVHPYQPQCIHTHADLQRALSGFPDTKEGNKQASQYLWGNYHWTRIALLRQFLDFLTSINVTDQPSLHAWARKADFERDFKGKVKGLGIAVFHWLLLRCGVSTIKPDIWVINFVKRVVSDRKISEQKLVQAFHEIAPLIGESLETVDLTIWYYERLAMATTDVPQLRIVWWHMFHEQLSQRLLASASHTAWQVELDDKEKLRYGDAGISIKNCTLCGSSVVDAPVTMTLHQCSWHKGLELELRVTCEAPLSQAVLDRIIAAVVKDRLEWVVSNEPSLEIRINEGINLKFVPTTTVAELSEMAKVIAQTVMLEIGEFEAFDSEYPVNQSTCPPA
jgi:hypothetical protein